MSDHGFHWTPCRGRGPSGRLWLVLLAVVVVAASGAAERAVTGLLEVVAIAAGATVLVFLAVLVMLWRLGRAVEGARRVFPERRPVVLTAVREADQLDGRPGRAGIEPTRARVSTHPRIDAQPDVVTRDDMMRKDCPYEFCHHNHPELPPPWERRRKEGDHDA